MTGCLNLDSMDNNKVTNTIFYGGNHKAAPVKKHNDDSEEHSAQKSLIDARDAQSQQLSNGSGGEVLPEVPSAPTNHQDAGGGGVGSHDDLYTQQLSNGSGGEVLPEVPSAPANHQDAGVGGSGSNDNNYTNQLSNV